MIIVGNDVRIKLKLGFQKNLFRKLVETIGGTRKVAKLLGISTTTVKRYKNGKIRYISYDLLLKVLELLELDIAHIEAFVLEKTTLKDVRRKYAKKAIEEFKRRYGNNYRYILASYGWEGLKKKYGKDWLFVIGKRGFEACKRKYGENYHKIIWNKAIKSLEQHYGKDWGKVIWDKSLKSLKRKYGNEWYRVILPNAWKALENKYGKDWPTILSKSGAKVLKNKYGNGYRKYLYELAKLHEHSLLTQTELQFTNLLKAKYIPFETHKIVKNMEYDVMIPSSKNPKIICELSDQIPRIHNLRAKIAQILLQKEVFPDAIYFFITNLYKTNSRGDNFNFSFDIFCYLREKGVIVIDLNDMNKSVGFILSLLNLCDNGNQVKEEIKAYLNALEDRLKSKTFLNTSHAASIRSFKNEPTQGERLLHKKLSEINANPLGSTTLQTKYGGYVTVDNYENCGEIKIIYEETSSKSPRTLEVLAGKIAFLKDNLSAKYVVVLSNFEKFPKEEWFSRYLKKFADMVIFKDDLSNLDKFKEKRKLLLTN
ncbi:MAG: hypothetical protein QMD14_02545 [Candidatus Aenigmarchaeota archaeon]|nr:hypothetical protein [Candidatus Aenigmarchaeota archaeon]